MAKPTKPGKEEKRAQKRQKRRKKLAEKGDARVAKLEKKDPKLAQIQKQLEEARRAKEEMADKVRQTAKAAREAAMQAGKTEGLVASREAQVVALVAELEQREYPAHRIAIDFGAGFTGAAVATVQNRVAFRLLRPGMPKPGEQPKAPNWFFRNFNLFMGGVHVLEGASLYGYTLYNQDGPPTATEEFARESGKTVAQLGTYQLMNYAVDEVGAWWERHKLERAKQKAALPAPMPTAPARQPA